jgi:acyl-coenzyme A thioesterase PaaI-like protein
VTSNFSLESIFDLLESPHKSFDTMAEPDLAHFKSIPWCSEIIAHPDFVVTPTISRQSKRLPADTLTATTLKTDDTIKACLTVYKQSSPGATWVDEVRSFMTLGEGMNGAPFMLHGGIVATLMDDCVGALMSVNTDEDNEPLSSSTVTAYLNVQYLEPVATPQTVMVAAKYRERKGRKFYVYSEIRDEGGNVLAKSESLWLLVQGVTKEML